MTIGEFVRIWPVLKRQVRTLDVPWLDAMASARRDPFMVLVSCVLSLRTKDKVTAEASQRLFRIAPDAEVLAKAPLQRIVRAIYPVGFYRVKAAALKEMSRQIIHTYGGRVPDTIDELLMLKGVGRKTANLVVTLGYGKDGICVDTHVHRITNRWGLVKTRGPEETEYALRAMLPVKYWKGLNGPLVAFGQGVCKPVSPLCSSCSVFGSCGRVGVTRRR